MAERGVALDHTLKRWVVRYAGLMDDEAAIASTPRIDPGGWMRPISV